MPDQLQSFEVTPEVADLAIKYLSKPRPAVADQQDQPNDLMTKHFEGGRANAQSSVVGAPDVSLPPQVQEQSPIPPSQTDTQSGVQQPAQQTNPFALLNKMEAYTPQPLPPQWRNTVDVKEQIAGFLYQTGNGNDRAHAGSLQQWYDWLLGLQHGGDGQYAKLGSTGQMFQKKMFHPPQGSRAEQELKLYQQLRDQHLAGQIQQQVNQFYPNPQAEEAQKQTKLQNLEKVMKNVNTEMTRLSHEIDKEPSNVESLRRRQEDLAAQYNKWLRKDAELRGYPIAPATPAPPPVVLGPYASPETQAQFPNATTLSTAPTVPPVQEPAPVQPSQQVPAPTQGQMEVGDQQAQTWAQANPNDPRSAQIIQWLNQKYGAQ